MKKETVRLTASQFAKLHHINKRTLHYYDNIGLFSPEYKGENGYRYYDYSQSIEFEFIRLLRDIHLSIPEIKTLISSFQEQEFIRIIDSRQKDITQEIERLKRVKTVLSQMQEHLSLCRNIASMDLRIAYLKEEKLITAPYQFEEDDFMKVFRYVQRTWPPEQYRAGVGSYISLDKVKAGKFENYDGLFSPVIDEHPAGNILLKPQGNYLCGYLKGSWDGLPKLYGKMLDFVRTHGLSLTGYAFEKGMNDFAPASEKDYVTEVAVKIENIP